MMTWVKIVLLTLYWSHAFANLNLRASGARRTLPTNHVVHQSSERPFYNIGHMANSIPKTLTFLQRGANAIEVDVEYADDDIYLYHGQPCDCFRYCWDREPLGRYLEFVHGATSSTNETSDILLPNFTVLYFDNKLKSFSNEQKAYFGIRFANYLARYFYSSPMQSSLKLVVAIYRTSDFDFLVGFIARLKELGLYDNIEDQIGFDLGTNTNPEEVASMWRSLNIHNIWQGEGISNCFNAIIEHNLDKLVETRDQIFSNLTKVYQWTVDLTDSMRAVLKHNIDGIMTNHPERLVRVLKEPQFVKHYRMATIYDDPFLKHIPAQSPPEWREMSNSRTRSLGFKVYTAMGDLRNSLFHFIAEVYHSAFARKQSSGI